MALTFGWLTVAEKVRSNEPSVTVTGNVADDRGHGSGNRVQVEARRAPPVRPRH